MADSNKFSASNLVVALNKREDALIGEALASWLNLPLPALKAIAAEFIQNEELASAIEKSLNAPKAGQKEDLVCKWLYHWYQIDSLETRRFVLRYIPQLIWVYMHNVTNSETPPGVEACLLCIYNHEAVERSDMEIIFQPPTLSLPSYLHKTSSDTSFAHQTPTATTPNPSAMLAPPAFTAPGLGPNPNTFVAPNPNLGQSSALTENALRQFNKQVKSVTVEKALKPIDLATNANRNLIIRIVLQRYNSNISLFPPRSWISYCKMCKRLVNFGFDFTITPMPLLKSKSFSNKYIEEDMDNLVLDSDEDFDDVDDDYPDELSDSDGDTKVRDVEKGESSTNNDDEYSKKKAKSPQMGTPGTPGTPRKRLTKSLRDSASNSTTKIPPLSFSSPRSASPSPSPSPKGIADSSSSITTANTTTTTTTQNIKNSVEMNGEATPKNAPRPPIRIILTPSCLQEMVTGLTFCIFKESYKEHALKALRKIHLRACYDLMPEIILSANALLHLEYQERVKSAPAIVKTSTPRGIN